MESVILYDNNEAWIINKHETNHINKNCKYFVFDGYIMGCSHKLDENDPIYYDLKKYGKYMFKSCTKNCIYKEIKGE